MKFFYHIFRLSGMLSILGISMIIILNLFAYSQLGNLPEAGEANEFSISSVLRKGDHSINNFTAGCLLLVEESYAYVFIFFMISALPGLIYGYFGRKMPRSNHWDSFWLLFFCIHLYLAILYLPKVFNWIYCLNCWYWDAF